MRKSFGYFKIAVALLFMGAAHAEQVTIPIGGLLKKLQGEIQKDQREDNTSVPDGFRPTGPKSGSISFCNMGPAFGSKNEFLMAARKGELIKARVNWNSNEGAALSCTLYNILTVEEKIDPLIAPGRRDNDRYCEQHFRVSSINIFNKVTSIYMQALDGRDTVHEQKYLADDIKTFLESSSACDKNVYGKIVHHNFKRPLVNLLSDYGNATKDYIDDLENKKRLAIEEKRAAERAAEERRQVEIRAEQQRQIDAERRRIEQQKAIRDKATGGQ